MGVATASGHPVYSGTFIPEVWSGNILIKFYTACTIVALANTDYEGEIKNLGDKVYVRQDPDITINNYYKGADLEIQRPEMPVKTLEIDQAKYFNAIVDDVDKYQSDIPLMDRWSADAAQQMKIEIDSDVFEAIYDDPHASNIGTAAGAKSAAFNMGTTNAPVAVTKSDILEYIVDMETILDEQNVPETGRWLTIPAWFAGMIMKSDLKDASLAGDGTSILRNGRLGRIGMFTLYKTNNIYSVVDGSYTGYYCMFGTKHAITFASQMTNMETLRTSRTFGTLLRGLNVYGFKTLKSEALGAFYCRKG